MKKTLILFVLLAMGLAAHAQKKITAKDLQGRWSLVSVSDGDVILYPEERRGILTETGREGLSKQEIKEEEADLASDAAEFADTVLTFNGDKITNTTDGEETLNGTFAINKGGNMISITADGDTDEGEISFTKDNMLSIYDPVDEAEYIFKKIQ